VRACRGRPAARAHVHTRNQLESRREHCLSFDPRDADRPVLERLSKRFERGTGKFGELVEEEHAAMSERCLSRPRARASADDRRHGGGVVRRSEGRIGQQRPFPRQHSGDRVDSGHLQRLVVGERRQDSDEPAGKHRLAGSGRTREQQVVSSGSRKLERAPRPLLSSHVFQVGQLSADRMAVRRDIGNRLGLAPKVRDCFGEVEERHRFDTRERRLRRGLGRAQQPLETGLSRPLRSGQHSTDRPQPSVKRELPDCRVALETL
jgi:hypothetical protein